MKRQPTIGDFSTAFLRGEFYKFMEGCGKLFMEIPPIVRQMAEFRATFSQEGKELLRSLYGTVSGCAIRLPD